MSRISKPLRSTLRAISHSLFTPCLQCQSHQYSTSPPQSLPKPLKNRIIREITKLFQEVESSYLNAEEWSVLRQRVRDALVEHQRENAGDEHDALLHLEDASLRQIVKKAKEQWQKVQITPEQRNLIAQQVENAPDPSNVAQIYSALSTMDAFRHFPRRQLHNIIHNEAQKYSFRTSALDDDQKRMIREHVEQASDWSNVVQLCEEIEAKLPKAALPPRVHIYKFIVRQIQQIQRQSIRKEHRQKVQEFIARHRESHSGDFLDAPTLRDEIKQEITDLPPAALYDLVLSEVLKHNRRHVSDQTREMIRAHVAESTHPTDVPRLCDELQHRSSLSRKQLYDLVKYEQLRYLERNLPDEQRTTIRDAVRHAAQRGETSIDAICEQLQHLALPKKVLRFVVRDEYAKCEGSH